MAEGRIRQIGRRGAPRPRIRRLRRGEVPSPRISMRVWLGACFALVGVLTAASVYFFVDDSSEQVIADRSTELAVGRTIRLADLIGTSSEPAAEVIASHTDPGFQAWYFDAGGRLVAPDPPGPGLARIRTRREAIQEALTAGRVTVRLPGQVTVVAAPVLGESGVEGAVLGRLSRPEVLENAIDRLHRDSLRALAIAVAIGILAGFIVATLISLRIRRLAEGAEMMAAGSFDVPLAVSGRDEVGDLSRALDSMRAALKESIGVLSSERDKLSSIFAGLADAVLVVDGEGGVRFSNPAAAPLINDDGAPIEALVPHLRRAAERGHAELAVLRVEDRVYSLQASDLPAEHAVLAVVRDRTDEARRELSEREFVSNAAHELRNPLAGISGAIEVLQAGAKDDPQAREHFLERLSDDVERMTRLTESLLTLARVEALGSGETEIVDVSLAAHDAAASVTAPAGVELLIKAEPDLAAKGDTTLLRQVLTGLLSNAFKNTPAPGTVTLRARRHGEGEVMLEVIDTGTGIPTEEVERVFERFYRRSGTLAQEGFGLGLAIASRMVAVMGGEIGATSEEGSGSTFWIRLPVTEPSTTPVA